MARIIVTRSVHTTTRIQRVRTSLTPLPYEPRLFAEFIGRLTIIAAVIITGCAVIIIAGLAII